MYQFQVPGIIKLSCLIPRGTSTENETVIIYEITV